MKGSLNTDQYMHAVLQRDNHLRTSRRLSHCMTVFRRMFHVERNRSIRGAICHGESTDDFSKSRIGTARTAFENFRRSVGIRVILI
jgi:hypothetical protein